MMLIQSNILQQRNNNIINDIKVTLYRQMIFSQIKIEYAWQCSQLWVQNLSTCSYGPTSHFKLKNLSYYVYSLNWHTFLTQCKGKKDHEKKLDLPQIPWF